MINQRNLHFTQAFRDSLSYERVTSDVESLLIPYLGVPLLQAPCCTHPDSQTVMYVIMLHPKLFTHHNYYYLSLNHLSYCHSCHVGNVCRHCYTLVHAFCRYTLGYCILPNSCNESSESVYLDQGFCLSSLEQVCPLLPSIPTQMAA